MMANPADALRLARRAGADAAGLPEGRPRDLAAATATWLEGEATARLDQPQRALGILERALATGRRGGADAKLLADIMASRGWAERAVGRVPQAMRDFQQAYALYRKLGEQRGEAKALQNIGGIYHDAGDNERSLLYYSQVADLAGDDPAIGLTAHNNLGETLKALGRYRAAETEYRRALTRARRLGSPLLEVRILTNLASTQLETGRIPQAEAAARRALALASGEAAGERPFALGVLALAAERRGDAKAAAALLGRTFEGQDLDRTTLSFRDFHETAARVYEHAGEQALAYRHLKAFKRLDDGARALAASTNAALMAAQFDFANQKSRISDLKAGQARRDRQLVESRAHFQTVLFSGALGAGGIVLVLLVAGLVSLRRSRNDVRAANARLSDSNDSLAKALRAKSEFLATTSHEIRTPLNGILGMTQVMLADPRVDPAMRDRIEVVHGAGETMRALVDDILDVAKIENGNLEMSPAPFDPAALMRDVARFWRGPAEGKGLAFSADIGALPARICGDAARLRQILFNILSNAVKFTPHGGVVFAVAATGERLAMTVADTGIGISADEQDAIFERFYQVDGGTSRQFGGTGLGLAICRHLASAMGGTITVESLPGRGAIFRVEIPIAIVAASSDDVAAPTGSDDRPGGASLLVVEPNPLVQRLLAKGLKALGEPLFVADAEAARERIAAGGIGRALAQVDALAAAGDPLPSLRMLAAAAAAAGVPLVLLYTPDGPCSAADLAPFGAHALIAKPAAMKDVLAALSDDPGVANEARNSRLAATG